MINRRKTLAIVAAVAAFGAVSAAAASLGGLTGTTLGADSSVVASCDTDGVTVGYTTSYNAAAKEYVVTAVQLTGVAAACNGKTANVTLADSPGTSLGAGSAAVAGTTVTVSVAPSASAKNVANVAVIIAG